MRTKSELCMNSEIRTKSEIPTKLENAWNRIYTHEIRETHGIGTPYQTGTTGVHGFWCPPTKTVELARWAHCAILIAWGSKGGLRIKKRHMTRTKKLRPTSCVCVLRKDHTRSTAMPTSFIFAWHSFSRVHRMFIFFIFFFFSFFVHLFSIFISIFHLHSFCSFFGLLFSFSYFLFLFLFSTCILFLFSAFFPISFSLFILLFSLFIFYFYFLFFFKIIHPVYPENGYDRYPKEYTHCFFRAVGCG